jgi:uncharacterized membrane protein
VLLPYAVPVTSINMQLLWILDVLLVCVVYVYDVLYSLGFAVAYFFILFCLRSLLSDVISSVIYNLYRVNQIIMQIVSRVFSFSYKLVAYLYIGLWVRWLDQT